MANVHLKKLQASAKHNLLAIADEEYLHQDIYSPYRGDLFDKIAKPDQQSSSVQRRIKSIKTETSSPKNIQKQASFNKTALKQKLSKFLEESPQKNPHTSQLAPLRNLSLNRSSSQTKVNQIYLNKKRSESKLNSVYKKQNMQEKKQFKKLDLLMNKKVQLKEIMNSGHQIFTADRNQSLVKKGLFFCQLKNSRLPYIV